MPPVTRPLANTSSSDPVIETQVLWMRYRMHILATLVAVLVALAAYGGYRFYDARKEAGAAALLADAKSAADYERVIATYPGASAAASAYLLLAEAQRKEQKLTEANDTLRRFIERDAKHELVPTAKMAMAANLESLGKPDEALDAYRKVAAQHPHSFSAPMALLAQVHLLKQKGQIDDARRVCETVVAQYGNSYAAMQAQQYLRALKVPPAAAAAPAPSANAAASISPAQASSPASAAPTP